MKQLPFAKVNRHGDIKLNLTNVDHVWSPLQQSSGAATPQQIRAYRKLRSKVAFFYQGAKTLSGHAARIPWQLIAANGDIITDSTDDFFPAGYQWLDSLTELTQIIVLSLIESGQAYLLKNRNFAGRNLQLQFVVADSMTPKYDEMGEVVSFKRTFKAGNGESKSQIIDADEVVYFWLPDSGVENAPPAAFPATAAFGAADVLSNMQLFKAQYFKDGTVRAGFLKYDGHISKEEAELTKSYFAQMINGVRNAFKQVVLYRNDITYEMIGDGLQGLDNNDLTQTEREDVLAALGVPPDMVLAPSGGMDSDVTSAVVMFYNGQVIPLVGFILNTINRQVLTGDTVKLMAAPESLPLFQADEGERSQQLQNLVTAGVDLIIAMKAAGYPEDIVTEQETAQAAKESRADEMAQQMKPAPEPEPPIVDDTRVTSEMRMLANWCKKRKGTQAHPSDFASDVLSYDAIADTMKTYGIFTPQPEPIDTKDILADVLPAFERMIMSQREPQTFNINVTPEAHNVTIQPSEIKAEFTVPAAMPPVVNVTTSVPDVVVNVAAPVVENIVNMPKRMVETTTVKRDATGALVGTESTSTFEE